MSTSNEPNSSFIRQEKRETGGLGVRFYTRYLKSMKGIYFFGPFLLILTLAENFFGSGFKWLVGFWLEGCTGELCVGKTQTEIALRNYFYNSPNDAVVWAFAFYVCLGLLVRFVSWTATVSFLANGARHMHDKMVQSLGRVRVTFFDENPTGRLVRRFSGDYSQLTLEIPNYMSDIANAVAELGWIVILVFSQAPLAGVSCVPCAAIYFNIQKNFKAASREVQRLSKVLETPVWSLFTETIGGYQTIRAYGRSEEFSQRLKGLNVRYGGAALLQSRLTRWLNVRLKFVSECFAFFVTLVVVWKCSHGEMGVGTAGFLMSLTIGLDMSMQWLTRSVSMLETAMVSFERVLEYQNLPGESVGRVNGDAPKDWPSRGEIKFDNFSMAYRNDLPTVLKNFSVTFPAGKQIGIIGRTGAGKSSLFQSLFQMVHVQSGQILIDGQDLGGVDMDAARSVFGIIPQEPQLFSGTLRYNLDRTGRFSDDAIWDALRATRLEDFVKALPSQLNYLLFERGANLSVGQRQLLCMARAILCDAKIILMDEATASVDFETENRIHEALLKGFAGRTILIIAHRLETVRGCDFVAVLGEGKLVQFGKANEVLSKIGVGKSENAIENYLV